MWAVLPVRWQSLYRQHAISQRQPEAPPYIDQRFSECIDQHVIVIGCRRDAQPLCAARDGRIIDRLDVDAVLGEPKIARFLALSGSPTITGTMCVSLGITGRPAALSTAFTRAARS
jgi:hypothetical protein